MNKLTMILIVLLFQPMVYALEVDREVLPRLMLGGRFVSTVDWLDKDSDPTEESHINLDDSSFLLALDKRIYDMQGVAGAVIGIKDSDQGVLMPQLHGRYWRESRQYLIGRTRIPNTLIEFPVLRDDDLMEFTHILNGGSNEEFAQVYGDLLSLDWFVDKKIRRLNVWLGTRESTIQGFNSYGLAYISQNPEDLIYVQPNRLWGIRFDRQKVNFVGEQWMTAYQLGIEQNLNRNPQGSWSMALQITANQGLSGAVDVSSLAARAKTQSQALVTSLRYTHRPKLLTRHQAALSFAYKDHTEVADGVQWSVIPSYICRFGQGIDMIAQLKFTDYGQGLGGGSDVSLQFGLSFSFDAVFNDQIGERDSILNLEHGYIP